MTVFVSRAATLGALASLTAGCGRVRQLWHHLASSCVDATVPSTATARLIEGVIPPRRAHAPYRYALAVPRGVDPRTVDRVVYVLPGRGGTAHDALTMLGYAAYAQQIVDSGARPFAVLAMDSGESYYHPRTNGEDRLAVAVNDLPRVARDRLADTLTYEALTGQSMGGYGALLAAERNPGRYRAVAVAGPALFTSYVEENRAIGDGFDSAEQFATYDVIRHARALAATPVMVRIGYDDPFLANVKAFAERVPHADIAYVEHGCHTDGFWRATAHELLTFASTQTSAA